MIKKLKTIERIKEEFEWEKDGDGYIKFNHHPVLISKGMIRYFGTTVEVKEMDCFKSFGKLKRYHSCGWTFIEEWFESDEFFEEDEFEI